MATPTGLSACGVGGVFTIHLVLNALSLIAEVSISH